MKMKMILRNVSIICASALLFVACNDDDDNNTAPVNQIDVADIKANYASLVLANYQAAMQDAINLETAINVLVDNPTQATFDSVKNSWLIARESYGTSEAFRFANGPIDTGDTEEIEGFLNSWPMDENYVDYVAGAEDAGIINNIAEFPTLTKEILAGENGKGGEENVSIGYHAI